MNRSIKFRGKRVDNGKLVYGYYVKHETRQTCPMGNDKLSQDEIKHLIVVDSFADWNMPKTLQGIEVIPETVGQFTGLYDLNGKEIYEGDIVKDVTGYVDVVVFGNIGYDYEFNGLTGFALSEWKPDDMNFYVIQWGFDFKELEIIGNIHDNKELL